jgi:hypothetical protein
MIQIRPVDAQDEEVWRSLLELRERYPEGWTLIGARMVTLYALEYARTPPRFSLDADALIDVRVIPLGTQRFSKLLLDLNYEMVDGVWIRARSPLQERRRPHRCSRARRPQLL